MGVMLSPTLTPRLILILSLNIWQSDRVLMEELKKAKASPLLPIPYPLEALMYRMGILSCHMDPAMVT